MPDEGAVEAELLAERDDVEGGLVTGAGVVGVEEADGEEAELLQRRSGGGHAATPRVGVGSMITEDSTPGGTIGGRPGRTTSCPLPHRSCCWTSTACSTPSSMDLPEGWRRGTYNGFVLSWDPTVTARLRELHESGRVELQWLTTWTENADKLLAEPMGLPRGLRTHGREDVLPTGFGGELPRPLGVVEARRRPRGRRGRARPADRLDRRRPRRAGRGHQRVAGRQRPGAGRGAGPRHRPDPRGAGPRGGLARGHG